MEQKRPWISWTVRILLSLAVALLAYWAFKPKVITTEVTRAAHGPFSRYLKVEAKTRSLNKVIVYSSARGDMGQLMVKQGDSVKKGQVLAPLYWDINKSITAPITGYVSKVFRESAGPTERGQPILEISSPEIEIVAEILTTDAVGLKPGQKVLIEQWGGPDQLEGQVTKIQPVGFTKISALGVEESRTEVLMNITSPKEKWTSLGDNYHVEAHILMEEHADVLLIANSSLFKDKDQWSVYVIQGNVAKLRHVEIAAKNILQAIVTKGLSPDDEVVLFPGDQVKDGVKLQIKR